MGESSEPRKTSAYEKDQPNNLRQRRSSCSFSAFSSLYESPSDGPWAWDGSLWPGPALFRVGAVVVPVFPPDAKGRAWPVAPAPTSAPRSASPTVESTPPPEDEPAPGDGEDTHSPASSVRCVPESSAVGYPRAPPACRSESPARASTATERSGGSRSEAEADRLSTPTR
jgi:hypothetical protein